MDITAERAAEIVNSLPAELRVENLATVLAVSVNHVQRMRSQNRVPKPVDPRKAVWQRDAIKDWLVERLTHREADQLRADKLEKQARLFLGCRTGGASRPPCWRFLGIGD